MFLSLTTQNNDHFRVLPSAELESNSIEGGKRIAGVGRMGAHLE